MCVGVRMRVRVRVRVRACVRACVCVCLARFPEPHIMRVACAQAGWLANLSMDFEQQLQEIERLNLANTNTAFALGLKSSESEESSVTDPPPAEGTLPKETADANRIGRPIHVPYTPDLRCAGLSPFEIGGSWSAVDFAACRYGFETAYPNSYAHLRTRLSICISQFFCVSCGGGGMGAYHRKG